MLQKSYPQCLALRMDEGARKIKYTNKNISNINQSDKIETMSQLNTSENNILESNNFF
jgi:hypothetical protein